MQCWDGGAVRAERVVWGGACVEREEGGVAAGGRLRTAIVLLGLKVFLLENVLKTYFINDLIHFFAS